MKTRVANDYSLRFWSISTLIAASMMTLGAGATPAQTSRALRLLGSPTIPQSKSAEPKIDLRFGVLRIEVPDGPRTPFAAVAVNPDDPEWVRLKIERDLDEEVEAGEMRQEVADGIAFEINGLAGAYYKVPELEQLKRDLGFPKDADLAPADQAQLLRVHVQRTLDVSVQTADYLMRLLGMEIDDTEPVSPVSREGLAQGAEALQNDAAESGSISGATSAPARKER